MSIATNVNENKSNSLADPDMAYIYYKNEGIYLIILITQPFYRHIIIQ